MYDKIFPTKARKFFLKRSRSAQDVSLNGKIIIGHCKGHDTIIFTISIEGFKEITKRLYLDYENAGKNLS